ncbi:MAG: hypothetical protein V7676_03360 [Parasphingorhabdus sp.]|uniref:hypothetical protein n=1 Tax=Parasphingorhabdus sp. TaxID=2709688 RepID=UPI0030019E5F
MGAEKIIFLCPTMHGALLQYIDILKGQGIDAEIVRNAGDLGQYVSQDDDMVFLGDGIIPWQSLEKHLSEQSGELVYVVTNANLYENFERIDLSQRWLGIALLKAMRLEEIAEIPDDWDIGSALLRTAVQSECYRELVSDEDMRADAVPQLLDAEASVTYAKRQLDKVEIPKQNFLDRFLVWPLMRRAIPSLWKAHEGKRYIGLAGMACAVIAAGLSLIVSPAISFGFLFLGALCIALHNRIAIFSVNDGKRDLTSLSFYGVAAIVLIFTVFQEGSRSTIFADIAILFLFVGNFWMVIRASNNSKLNLIRPDILLVLLILLIASAAGFFSIGLYISALLCMAYLITAQTDFLASKQLIEPHN